MQIYQNCTQYCTVHNDNATTFAQFRFCLELEVEKVGYNGGEMTMENLCGRARVLGGGRSGKTVGWLKGVVVLRTLLVLMM